MTTSASPDSGSASDRPVLRLLPKANARAIRRGAPWVFDNELVMDRRTRGIAPGTIATLEDHERKPLATVAVNPGSKIVARVLDREIVEVGTDWLRAKVAKALSLRERLYDAPFYRLIHAEADGFPGVIVDRFGDTLVVQPNAAWADVRLPELAEILAEVTGCTNILKNASGRGRALEGLDDADAVLLGAAPDAPVPVVMNGATYMADLTGGQKTGLFYDQRDNHAFAARLAAEGSVIDVFSHVGGFGLAAPLVAEDGYLVLCSCSHAADMTAFTGACLRGIGRAGRRAVLIHTGQAGADHPLLPQLAESGYLKALFFRL